MNIEAEYSKVLDIAALNEAKLRVEFLEQGSRRWVQERIQVNPETVQASAGTFGLTVLPRPNVIFIDPADVLWLVRQFKNLWASVCKHRDFRGDDRCWMDDRELYNSLPGGYRIPKLDTAIELINCQRFLECRKDPKTTYISSQRRIEELEAEVARLKEVEASLIRFQQRTAGLLQGDSQSRVTKTQNLTCPGCGCSTPNGDYCGQCQGGLL